MSQTVVYKFQFIFSFYIPRLFCFRVVHSKICKIIIKPGKTSFLKNLSILKFSVLISKLLQNLSPASILLYSLTDVCLDKLPRSSFFFSQYLTIPPLLIPYMCIHILSLLFLLHFTSRLNEKFSSRRELNENENNFF